MPNVASVIPAALATANHRNTRTGAACRSAMAPKTKGDNNAATAEVAKAGARISAKPCADSTRPSGTIHIPMAIAWRKNSPASSVYSGQRGLLLNTVIRHLTFDDLQEIRLRISRFLP